jgi:alpha-D-ribose 1-methylphosphonate 5-triphosphate diphosphatase
MPGETAFHNASIVFEDRIVSGTLLVKDGRIVSVDEGRGSVGEDLDGDYLTPGLIELHTDHLEAHYSPRPGVRWQPLAAVQAHDAQIATSGITTVFDCLRMGSIEIGSFSSGEMRQIAEALASAKAENRLRSDHHIHLRCEVSAPDMAEHFLNFAGERAVRLVSLMDHAPGQRQFRSMDQYILYYKTRRGLSDAEFEAFVNRRISESRRYSVSNSKLVADFCAERQITVASHDDATLEHVGEAIEFGARLAEFPTSMEAAIASHEAGMSVLMGAPNVVRGGSHSGNIAASDLARKGVLDVLSSDYVPFSLVHAPFVLADSGDCKNLAEAFGLVTANPARAVGLGDRGRIEPGLRADLVRIRRRNGVPVVVSVWREGVRVA